MTCLVHYLVSEFNNIINYLVLDIYRLDRLTSGVLILAKTPEKTRQLEDEIFGKHVQKEYVCRVVGEFPQ